MGKGRVTIKQIAEEAGVSIATVSYVLNNRLDQKISEEKAKKIRQLANLYHYSKNQNASNLAQGRSMVVSLVFPEGETLLELANRAIVLGRLSEAFKRKKIRVSSSKNEPLGNGRNFDAVIAFGLKEEDFRSLADRIYVPIISVDSLVVDRIFNDVSDNLMAYEGNDVLIALPVYNLAFREYLAKHFRLIEVRTANEAYKAFRDFPGAYLRDPALLAFAKEAGMEFKTFDKLRSGKLEAIFERVISAIEEEGEAAHLLIA